MNLPDLAQRLIDSHAFATIGTINPDGSPQNSVIWIKREGDTVMFSTILGRRKTRNMERDPRVSILLFDPQDPYSYVEIRGMVSMTKDGGPELIQELSMLYDGKPFTEKNPANVRVVCRVTTTKVVSH